jgi:L-ascorbate metabolism protein UlaG (beta-lactamase superfamily)
MPLQARPVSESFFADHRHDCVYAWLGSAGFLFNVQGTVLLIDPLLPPAGPDQAIEGIGYGLKIRLPIQAEDVPRAGHVLYTHGDADHFCPKTAEILDRQCAPVFMAPPPVVERLKGLGVETKRLVSVCENNVVDARRARVTVTPALHDWNPARPHGRNDCCGYLIGTACGNFWDPGETRLLDELLDVKDVDVILFDVSDARAHLGPRGSMTLAESSGARDLVCYHYGTFDSPAGGPFGCDPEDYRHLANSRKFNWLTPAPGEVRAIRRWSPPAVHGHGRAARAQ